MKLVLILFMGLFLVGIAGADSGQITFRPGAGISMDATTPGDVEMWGGNVNNATFGNFPGGYTAKVYIKDSGVYAQWANGTIIYSGSAATQSREAIQAATYAHHGTTLICDMLTTDDDVPIYLNWTNSSEPVQHRILGLGPATGITTVTGSTPVLYAYDGDSNPRTGTNTTGNGIVIQNLKLVISGSRDGIYLDSLGTYFQSSDISNLYIECVGATTSGSMIHLYNSTGLVPIHDCYMVGSYDPRTNNDNQKNGIYIDATDPINYFITGEKIYGNHIVYCRNGIYGLGVNASKYAYLCGTNIINNFILGCDAGIRLKYADSPIIVGNVIDNVNTSVLCYDVHAPQITANQCGNSFSVGTAMNERGSISIAEYQLPVTESGVIISNNRMQSYGSASSVSGYAQILIYGLGTTSHWDKHIISGNEIRVVNDAGIRFVSGGTYINHSTINGNVISDTTGTSTSIQLTSAAIGYTNVIGNVLSTYTKIEDASTSPICRLNDGYVTESSGSSTGSGWSQTIAHGLVSTPVRVSFIPTASGATVSAWYADSTNIHVTVTKDKAFNWAASTW